MLNSGKIIFNRELAGKHYHLRLILEEPFLKPRPGQFFLIRLNDRLDPLLGRPFSVYDCHHQGRMLDFVYRVVGRGTGLFSKLKKGGELSLLGPLGRPFNIFPEAKTLVLIGGVMGAAALNYLLKEYTKGPAGARSICYYLGAKTAREIIGKAVIERRCQVMLTTDDGSKGRRGLITDLLEENLESLAAQGAVFYACGPRGMLRRLFELISPYKVSCQVSLEERMACGLGACLGCAVEARGEDDLYRRVCCDGPVFEIGEIVW